MLGASQGKTGPVEAEPAADQTAVPKGPAGQAMSAKSRAELSVFISASVLPQTGKVYEKNWQLWVDFVRVETGREDPFLTGMSEEDKAALVGLMMLR